MSDMNDMGDMSDINSMNGMNGISTMSETNQIQDGPNSQEGSSLQDELYSIGELAKQSGVGTRTLRHYESLGLLSPKRQANGYRAYDARDAKKLAQILAMKLCGLPLGAISKIMTDSEASLHRVLSDHLQSLRAQMETLTAAIARTESALKAIERIENMTTTDAFEELKAKGLQDFEATYGEEARERYGEETIDAANARMMALSQDEWDAKELLEESIKVQLSLALATGDPTSEEAQELARMHKRWITIHWGEGYEEETYLDLVKGYLADPRFVHYYDSAAGDGATAFLVEAVTAYAS